ncbi:MAG TPA: DUF899 family protein [Streptosporangiaceae bacterium]
MSLPRIASRDDWRAARIELLAREKELTRQRDALSAERRNLPMVEIEKDHVLDGPAGPARLPDLFEGRAQLIIYHFMYDPEWEVGCSSCTAGTDELLAGFLDRLHTRDTTYAMVSRAPLAKLEAWKAERGWDVPWYSSYGTDFNYDFGVPMWADCVLAVLGVQVMAAPGRQGRLACQPRLAGYCPRARRQWRAVSRRRAWASCRMRVRGGQPGPAGSASAERAERPERRAAELSLSRSRRRRSAAPRRHPLPGSASPRPPGAGAPCPVVERFHRLGGSIRSRLPLSTSSLR